MTLPKLEALQTWAASAFGGHIDAAANAYVAAGDYYWSSVANGGSVSLLSAFQTLLAASVASTTVVLNANGTITITWGSGTHTYAFASTTVRDRLGFTGNLTPAAAAFTSQRQAKGLWLPNILPGDQDASVATQGRRVSSRRITEAKDGSITKTSKTRFYAQKFLFTGLTKAKTWTGDESLVNESAETFWSDALDATACAPFRYHADRTVDATYFTYHDKLAGGFAPTKRVRRNDVRWDWEIPCNGYVHVATGGGF